MGYLDFHSAAKQMRRLLELYGGSVRQDVLAATDLGMGSEEVDLSSEAWAAYRKAKKAREDPSRRSRS